MAKFALEDAVKIAGGQTQLANKINSAIDILKNNGFYHSEAPPPKVRQTHIWKWLHNYKKPVPPAEYVLPIEAAVQIPKEVQREDLYRKTSNAL